MSDSAPSIVLPVFGVVKIKYLSLICLIVQNVVLVLAIGYSRGAKGSDGLVYISATAITMSELLKLVAATLLEYFLETPAKQSFTKKIYNEFANLDTVKLAVPGILYVIQNNLLFVALSHLSVAQYQVTAQVKILTTAMFSFIMLGTRISKMQILSLFLLTAGVAIVQLANAGNNATNNENGKSQIIGLVSILCACTSSGFAGIYFEKILKHGRSVSLYIRNCQLAVFGVIFGLIQAYVEHGDKIRENGFFQGYTNIVWLVISVQALGGLMVAVVMKYADNILKGFATSCAIVLGSLFSAVFFGASITVMFVFGAILVIAAVYIYGAYPLVQTSTRTYSRVRSGSAESEDIDDAP